MILNELLLPTWKDRPTRLFWDDRCTICGIRLGIAGHTHRELSQIAEWELNWIELKASETKTISKIIRKWSTMEYFAFCIVYLCHHIKYTHSISHRTAAFIQPAFSLRQFKIAAMLIGSQYKSFTFIEVFSLLASHFWFMKHNLVFCFSQQQQQQQQQASLLFCVRRTESDTI